MRAFVEAPSPELTRNVQNFFVDLGEYTKSPITLECERLMERTLPQVDPEHNRIDGQHLSVVTPIVPAPLCGLCCSVSRDVTQHAELPYPKYGSIEK